MNVRYEHFGYRSSSIHFIVNLKYKKIYLFNILLVLYHVFDFGDPKESKFRLSGKSM